MNFGDYLECLYSEQIHKVGIPVLIWPQLLRSYGVGQLDIVRLYNGQLEVIEVKSSGIISKNQLRRIKNSCHLLAQWLDKNVELKLVAANICQRERPFLSY